MRSSQLSLTVLTFVVVATSSAYGNMVSAQQAGLGTRVALVLIPEAPSTLGPVMIVRRVSGEQRNLILVKEAVATPELISAALSLLKHSIQEDGQEVLTERRFPIASATATRRGRGYVERLTHVQTLLDALHTTPLSPVEGFGTGRLVTITI